MNAPTVETVFRMVLAVVAGLMFAFTLALALFAYCRWSRRRLKAAVRKCGYSTVGFLLVWGALLAYSQNVTREDKDAALEQEGEAEAENAVMGGLLMGSPARTGFRSGFCGFGSGGVASAHSEDPAEVWGLAPEAAPCVRAPTDSDYEAGFALTRIGTDEIFDFVPPEGAEVYEPWTRFGAARHWFRIGNGERGTGNGERGFAFPFGTNEVDALTVFSDGILRPKTKDAGTFLAPLHADLGLAPAYWWERLGDQSSPSRFWSAHTPSGGMLFTWENALFDRDASRPVSFQAELCVDGSVEFRYDLSRLDASDLTNLVVGVGFGNSGRVFTELQPGTTSLRWRRLDPLRAGETDPDEDGLSTDDELLVTDTDPYSPDSDGDGILDGNDAAPMNPDVDEDGIPDGMTELAYRNHPLWADEHTGSPAVITLNAPVLPPAFAVLSIDDLRIVLTTNATYRLRFNKGDEHEICLQTNRIQPIDLSFGGATE